MKRVFWFLIFLGLLLSCKKKEKKECCDFYNVRFWQKVGSGYDTTSVQILDLDTIVQGVYRPNKLLITTEQMNVTDCGWGWMFRLYREDKLTGSQFDYVATELKPGGKVWQGTFTLGNEDCTIIKLE